jgi:HPt (histidine-containing phosphotransfer) domain-containing protein
MKGLDINSIPSAAELQAMFIEGARDSIAQLDQKYQSACAGELPWPDVVSDMRGIAHDIKGQGGSFGYPLITEVGQSLSMLLKHERVLSELGLKLLAAHVTALATILENTIQGDGGELGGSYTQRLSALVEGL